MSDFLFRGDLKSIDPQVNDVIRMEAERQDRKLIMIPSESSAPQSVREFICRGLP
jgi:glycine hydroxymethyltransferase